MSTAQYAAMTPEQAALFMPDPPPQLARKRLAELVAGRDVVDIGCSRAEEVDLYRPEQYLGVDCSAALVEVARGRWPGYRFEVCSGQDLPKLGHWPVGIMKAVLEHVPPAEALELYTAARHAVGTLFLCWHWEPAKQLITTYQGTLGTMLQIRHERDSFKDVAAREVVGNHVIWTIPGLR